MIKQKTSLYKKEENSIIKEDMKARNEGIKGTGMTKMMIKDDKKDKVAVKPKEEEEKSMYNNKKDKTEVMEVYE